MADVTLSITIPSASVADIKAELAKVDESVSSMTAAQLKTHCQGILDDYFRTYIRGIKEESAMTTAQDALPAKESIY